MDPQGVAHYFCFAEGRGRRARGEALEEWVRQQGMSKSHVRRQAESGGLQVNGRKVTAEQLAVAVDEGMLLGGRFMVVRFGKKNYYLLELE